MRLRNCDGYPSSDCAVVRTDSRQLSTVFDYDCCQDRISSFPTESNDRMKSESYRILSEIFRRNPIGFRQRGFRRNPIGTCRIASEFDYSRLNLVVFPIGLDRNPWSERSTWDGTLSVQDCKVTRTRDRIGITRWRQVRHKDCSKKCYSLISCISYNL